MRLMRNLAVMAAAAITAVIGFTGTAFASTTQGPYTIDGSYAKTTQTYVIWSDKDTGRYTFDLYDDAPDGWCGRAFVYVDYYLGNPDGSVSHITKTYKYDNCKGYGGGAVGVGNTVSYSDIGDYTYAIYSISVWVGRYKSGTGEQRESVFHNFFNPYYYYPA